MTIETRDQKYYPLPRFYQLFALSLSGLFSWIYYPRWWFVLPGMLLGLRQIKAWWKEKQVRDRNKAMEESLLSFFERLMNYLDAGYNPLESWAGAGRALKGEKREGDSKYQSMQERDGQEKVTEEVLAVIRKYEEGKSLEEALEYFSQELSSPLVENFIRHFILGIRQGGDLAQLTESFYRLLFDRQELNRDRETKLYAAKRELVILFIMPFVLLASLRYSALEQGGEGLFHFIIHLFCLGLFYLAWRWAKAIINRTELKKQTRSL